MATVTVQLSAEIEQQLRRQASERGETLEEYLRHLAERDAHTNADSGDMLDQGIEWLMRRSADQVQAARSRILAASEPPRDLPAGQSIVAAVEGKWPNPETDAEIRDALERMS